MSKSYTDSEQPPTCLHALGQGLVNALFMEAKVLRRERDEAHKMSAWHPASEPPDDEVTVLLALSDGEVWTGFHLAGEWRFVCGELVDQGNGTTVTHWAEFPEPPRKEEGAE